MRRGHLQLGDQGIFNQRHAKGVIISFAVVVWQKDVFGAGKGLLATNLARQSKHWRKGTVKWKVCQVSQ